MNSNVTKYVRYPRLMLMFFGLWPTKNRSILLEIYAAFVVFEQYIFLVFNGVYILMMKGDVQAMSDASYLFFTQLALCCRSIAFSLKRGSITKVLDMMDDDIFMPECDDHEKSIKKYGIKCRNLYIVLIICFTNNITWWTVGPLLSPEERRYPYNEIWFPVDRQKSPQYELAYVYEVIAIFSSGFIFLSVDVFSVATMLFICAQLDILRDKMKKIKPMPVEGKLIRSEREKQLTINNRLLVEFIKHHQAIKRFLDQIDDAIHMPVFFQLCTAVLIICIIALRLAQVSPTSPIFYSILNYFVLMLLQLYLYCWCGTELTDKSAEFREWLYEVPWYEQDKRFNSTLCILMECTKKPLVFKAGHYVLLARATFVSVLRCSYSYFAVLQQANE